MVQDGISPDSVEKAVGEGQELAIGLDKVNRHAVGLSATARLIQIPKRQIEGGQACAPACQNHSSHAVTAAKIKNVQLAQFPELFQGRAEPRLVIQVRIVVEVQVLWPPMKCDCSLPRLPVVK
jgi:hypothetical protein